jgi:hypothetical protein
VKKSKYLVLRIFEIILACLIFYSCIFDNKPKLAKIIFPKYEYNFAGEKVALINKDSVTIIIKIDSINRNPTKYFFKEPYFSKNIKKYYEVKSNDNILNITVPLSFHIHRFQLMQINKFGKTTQEISILRKKTKNDIENESKFNLIEKQKYIKTKAGKIWNKHQNWTRADCELLSLGQVWIGMRTEMLVYLRGNPNTINKSNYGNGNQYQYCWDSKTPMCFYDKDNDGKIDSYN